MTWKEISLDSLAAAKALLADEHYRSAVSRAYYAVYSRIVGALVGKATFPSGYEGPHHEDLDDLFFDYLSRVSIRDRWRYASSVKQLYVKRLEADYQPSATVDMALARDVVVLASEVFRVIEASYE